MINNCKFQILPQFSTAVVSESSAFQDRGDIRYADALWIRGGQEWLKSASGQIRDGRQQPYFKQSDHY